MDTPAEILRDARHVVVQDYPRAEIPDALARGGWMVTVYGGPDEADVITHELVDGKIVNRPVGRRPDTADLLYVFRPLGEIDAILADAHRMGVRTIWRQPAPGEADSVSTDWRKQVEASGIGYLDSPDIDGVAGDVGRPA